MLAKVFAGLASIAALAALGVTLWALKLQSDLHDAEIEAARLRGALADCRAATNIRNEDAERDAKFDPNDLPDFDELDPSDRLPSGDN